MAAAGSPVAVASRHPAQLPGRAVAMALRYQHKPPPPGRQSISEPRARKMLPGANMAPTPVPTSEGQFPLGPFPRHIWIHENTPQDSLDKVCHEIWKRVQALSDRLHTPAVLVPPLQHTLCSEPSTTFQKHRIDSPSSNYLLDEPEGLESIYKAAIENREREMKLRALCNAQLSAKPVTPSLLHSVHSQKNSKGLEGGSMTGAHSVEGSKQELPFLLKHTDPAKGADNQVTAEETKEVKELIQNSLSSSANSSTTVSLTTTAKSQAPRQKQQLLPSAAVCAKTYSDAVTKNRVTTRALHKKKVEYYASTSGFSTTSRTTALHQPVRQRPSFPPSSVFTNHSNFFPQFQGPHHQSARMPYQQALHPFLGWYSRQVLLYSPQPVFQPPYTPVLNYIPLVQPGYPYQQMILLPTSSNIQDLPPMAGNGIQNPFSLSYGFSSVPGDL